MGPAYASDTSATPLSQSQEEDVGHVLGHDGETLPDPQGEPGRAVTGEVMQRHDEAPLCRAGGEALEGWKWIVLITII